MTLAVETGSLRRYQGKWRPLIPEVGRYREDKGWSFTKAPNMVSQKERACIWKLAHPDYNSIGQVGLFLPLTFLYTPCSTPVLYGMLNCSQQMW